MSYCNGNCKYLDKKRHKCILTGENLTNMKQSGVISFSVHEHEGFCTKDGKDSE